MNVQDRRVKRTQRMLAEALIALTLEKGYFSVSIRDITDRADVAYATFFRHYADKDALLHDVLDVIIEGFLERLHLPSSDIASHEVGAIVFHYVQDHSEVCRVLLGKQGNTDLVREMIEKGTLATLESMPSILEETVPRDIVAYHIVSSTVSLIQWWLDHQMPYSPERMGEIFAILIMCPSTPAIPSHPSMREC
jgi:AcrR family transcriptional regulator